MEQTPQYSAKLPYPPVRVEGHNAAYGKAMLSNLGGYDSEMSAVSLYFYDHLVTRKYQEVSLAFHKISVVEMHHMEIFGQLAFLLGEDPRLWEEKNERLIYWSPTYNEYSFDLKTTLLYAIHAEKAAIRKYKSQMQVIKDPYIVANLERIILDEEQHVTIFMELYQTYFH